MAGPTDPFTPGVDPNATGGLDEALAPIGRQISSFMADPRGRAALMQFGIQAAQPMAWGQTGFGGLASAVGAAGEAVAREGELQRKDTETEMKQQLAEAKMAAQAARTGAAADRLTSAGEKLALQKHNIELTDEAKKNANRTRLVESFRRDKNEAIKHNLAVDKDMIMNPEQKAAAKRPVPTVEEWVKSQGPLIKSLGLDKETEGLVGGSSGAPTSGGSPAPPKVGQVINGYRYKGGPIGSKTSYEKADGEDTED